MASVSLWVSTAERNTRSMSRPSTWSLCPSYITSTCLEIVSVELLCRNIISQTTILYNNGIRTRHPSTTMILSVALVDGLAIARRNSGFNEKLATIRYPDCQTETNREHNDEASLLLRFSVHDQALHLNDRPIHMLRQSGNTLPSRLQVKSTIVGQSFDTDDIVLYVSKTSAPTFRAGDGNHDQESIVLNFDVANFEQECAVAESIEIILQHHDPEGFSIAEIEKTSGRDMQPTYPPTWVDEFGGYIPLPHSPIQHTSDQQRATMNPAAETPAHYAGLFHPYHIYFGHSFARELMEGLAMLLLQTFMVVTLCMLGLACVKLLRQLLGSWRNTPRTH
nr:hypothetical protein CFP56_01162 [Quercus suber]